MKRIKSGFALVALAALLNGCGGGGDGEVVGASSTTSAASSDPIDKYVGTIARACNLNTWITDAATGLPLYEKVAFTSQSKVSATKMLFQARHDIYDSSNCSGSPRVSLTVSGANTWISVDGTTTIGGTVADKVSSSEDVKLPGITAGTAITVNGVRYSAKYVEQTTGKGLFALVGKDLYFGDFSKPLDTQGYPTALLPQSTATMQ